MLTVVIPTLNRAKRVSDLLDSLAVQDPVSFAWEVVVVDNGSKDGTQEVVRAKGAALPINIRYVLEARTGLHFGRHRGAEEAKGHYLAYLDDDMLLAKSWLAGIEPLVDGKADLVVGRILPQWEVSPDADLLKILTEKYSGLLGLLDLGPEWRDIAPRNVFGGNCFFAKQWVFELGGFHPDGFPPDLLRCRGDGEGALMARFEEHGLRARYEPRATAFHIMEAKRSTLAYLCGRSYQQGISESFTQIRAQHGLDGHLGPPGGTPQDKDGAGGLLPYAKKVGRSLRQNIRRIAGGPSARAAIKVADSHKAGWRFHQAEVKRDPQLLAYVLRPSYLDEKPSGVMDPGVRSNP